VTKAGPGTGTVTSSPAGINCGGTCVATFANGTSVSLSERPGARSRFVGWSGDCSGRSACVLSMTANHSVKATFAKALAPPSCIVPKVVGKSLAKARAAITKAHCKVGKVTRKASSARKKGKVIGQSPKAGKQMRNGARVNVTVGRGPLRKK
jgi:PASTA domain/Divergent InlB B-repeat domain